MSGPAYQCDTNGAYRPRPHPALRLLLAMHVMSFIFKPLPRTTKKRFEPRHPTITTHKQRHKHHKHGGTSPGHGACAFHA